MRTLLPTLLLAGCIPGFPPPSHYTALNPAPVFSGPTAEVAVTPLSIPPFALSAAYTSPLPEQPWFLLEARGSIVYGGLFDPDVNGGAVAAAPGLWIVTRPGEQGGHFGARIGGSVGTGDLLGVYEWKMPYIGPSLHLQYANLVDRTAFSTTLGAELSWPMFPEDTRQGTDSNGSPVTIFPFPSFWVGLDVRGDFPVGERSYLVLGGGLDANLLVFAIPSPNLTIGARF